MRPRRVLETTVNDGAGMSSLSVCPMPLPYLLKHLPFCFLFHFLVCDLAFIQNFLSCCIEFWVTLINKIIRFSFASVWSAVMRKVRRRGRCSGGWGCGRPVEPLQMPGQQCLSRGGMLRVPVPALEHALCSCSPRHSVFRNVSSHL